MKLDNPGLCFFNSKALVDLQNLRVVFYQCSAIGNSELRIRNFHSKHDSMCKRKIPSYCFWVYSKKAITRNSLDREPGVFRRYQVIAISLGLRDLHESGLPVICTVIWHCNEKAPY